MFNLLDHKYEQFSTSNSNSRYSNSMLSNILLATDRLCKVLEIVATWGDLALFPFSHISQSEGRCSEPMVSVLNISKRGLRFKIQTQKDINSAVNK